AFPGVRRGQLAELGVAIADRHERQAANRWRWVAGCAHEARVLVVRDRRPADVELADEHAMDGSFIVLCVRRTHEEIARGYTRQLWSACCQRRQYSPGPRAVRR